MKKILSLTIVMAMLLCAFSITTSATNANTYIPEGIEVPMFTKAPDIDGTITTEEWVGDPSVVFTAVEGSVAAGDGVSKQNVFFDPSYSNLFDEEKAGMSTKVWFRYDANNLYVAAIVHDMTDVFNIYTDQGNLWNGDNIQIKIDPQGPNSAMLKLDPNYNWKTTPFSNEVFNWEIFDEDKGEWVKANNNQLKLDWFKNVGDIADYTLALSNGTTATGFNNATGAAMSNIAVKAVETADGGWDICYEMALPWAEIYAKFPGYAPTAGTALGIVIGVTESYDMAMAEGWRLYDSCYSWGTGLYGGQALVAPDTIGGTNAIVLLDASTARTPYEEYVPPVVDDNNGSTEDDAGATEDNKNEGTEDNTNKAPQTGDTFVIFAIVAVAALAVVATVSKKRLARNAK